MSRKTGRATIPGRRDGGPIDERNAAVRNDRPPGSRVGTREGDQLVPRSTAKWDPGRRDIMGRRISLSRNRRVTLLVLSEVHTEPLHELVVVILSWVWSGKELLSRED